MIEVAIVGGGIGGLTTAIALRQYGFEPLIFEQAPALLDLGAAIALWPNAIRALQRVGVAEQVLASAGIINEIRWLTRDGTELNSVRIPNLSTPAVALHRADLQRILLQSLPSALIKLGHSFVNHHPQTDSVIVRFTNSDSITCRFLVGADGIHSSVRAAIISDASPEFRGYIVWRGIAPARPEGIPSDVAIEVQGRGERFGIGPVGGGRIGWWAAANTSVENLVAVEVHTDAHDELLELFHGWYAPVRKLIESTSVILRTEATDRPSITTWGRGRTTLLGDAIHPTTPNLGQGGCMAVEDAVVLARCFEKYGPTESALRAYERVRYSRTANITQLSRLYGDIGQWESSSATLVRSKTISLLPTPVIRQLLKLVFGYDAATVRI
ncbi:MAG TPA: FAD-dependent monooxygenase [Pyrinomonadaceae bacterium]|jgi:2-polyprenyl-6-methoxyphenol hydroxylase-like FAD-dependent oxidoreductase